MLTEIPVIKSFFFLKTYNFLVSQSTDQALFPLVNTMILCMLKKNHIKPDQEQRYVIYFGLNKLIIFFYEP
jgi:hypothetical protein